MVTALDRTLDIEEFAGYLQNRVSPNTARVYLYAVTCWQKYLNGAKPTRESAQGYISSLTMRGLNASTANLHAHAIMRWFKWHGQKIELDSPTVRTPEPKYLSMDGVNLLLANCNSLLEEVLITVLFDTAVRISELLSLETSDIDWHNGFILITRKGGREEQVNISPKAMSLLEKWLQKRQFTSKRVFGDLEYQSALIIVKRVGNRAGIVVTPHMIRHSRAAQMRMSGATLEDIRDHLGHKNIATTANIYSSLKAIDLKRRIPDW